MNWNDYRELFPACKEYAYFSSAAAAPIPTPVFQAISGHYQKLLREGGSAFVDGAIIEKCRVLVAKLINSRAEEIAFVPNVAFAMNAIALSLKTRLQASQVILPEMEFPSCSLPWENAGYKMNFISATGDLEENLLAALQKATSADILVLSYAQYISGYKTDLTHLAVLAQKKRVPLIVDATQIIGTTEIDVQAQQLDVLAATGHKWLFCGYGISFMYIRPSFFENLQPMLVGPRSCQETFDFKNSQPNYFQSARVFELGNMNLSAFYGLEAALNLIFEIGVSAIEKRIRNLMDYLMNELKAANIPVMFDNKPSACSGIVQIGPFKEIQQIEKKLKMEKIQVISRLNGLRISLHFFNNEKDIDRLISVLKTKNKAFI